MVMHTPSNGPLVPLQMAVQEKLPSHYGIYIYKYIHNNLFTIIYSVTTVLCSLIFITSSNLIGAVYYSIFYNSFIYVFKKYLFAYCYLAFVYIFFYIFVYLLNN